MRLTCTPRRQQRGSVIAIAAIALSLIVIALIGTELGYLFFMKREFQKTADLAALAGAQKLQSTTATNRCELAAGAATSNAGQNLSGIAIDAPDCGNWTAGQSNGASVGCFAGTDDHFVVLGSPLNAIRVRINQPAPTLLPFFPWNRTICVQAVAALEGPQASFSIGSGVARLDAGVLNQMLSMLLGTEVKLTLADYTGLANAKLNLLGMVDALHLDVGTYEKLADANIKLDQLLNAAINILPQDNAKPTADLVATLLNGILSANGRLDFDEISINLLKTIDRAGLLDINLKTTDPRTALNGKISALSLLFVALQIADNQSAVAAQINIPLLPLANVQLKTKVIQPPVIAIGPPGYNPPPDNSAKTKAHTGQIRALVSVQVLTPFSAADKNLLNLDLGILRARVSLPSGALINLPIYLEVGSGDAKLEEVRCTDPDGKYDVKISATPSLAHLFLGDIPKAFDNSLIPWEELQKNKFSLLKLDLNAELYAVLGWISLAKINLGLLAKLDLSIPGDGKVTEKPLNYRFDPTIPNSDQNLTQTVGTEEHLGEAVASAIDEGKLELELDTKGLSLLGIPLDLVSGLLDGLVNGLSSIVNTILPLLKDILKPVLAELDKIVLAPLLKAIGLQLGFADVQLLSASCERTAKLVY